MAIMIVRETTVPTESASRYLQQLSKHWAHKFAVTFTPTASTIPFDDECRAHLSADAAALHIRLTVPDEQTAARMQTVIEDHLNRFAFRERALAYEWKNVTAG